MTVSDYPPLADIGRCIYCGATGIPLTQEHIVPYALNGLHTLQRATCKACEQVTCKIEESVLRTTFIAGRRFFKMRSRRNKQWEAPEKAFLALVFPVSEMPGYLEGAQPSSGINIKDLRIIPLTPATPSTTRIGFKGVDLFKMLAKIGLGFAIAEFGYAAFETFYVNDFILNKTDTASYYVGTATDNILGNEDLTYKIKAIKHNGDALVRIKLFAALNVPEYIVVVGKLRRE